MKRYKTSIKFILGLAVLGTLLAVTLRSSSHTQTSVQLSDLPSYVSSDHTVAVVMLETESEHLWDQSQGIYTNFLESGDDWERPATLTFFDPVENRGFRKEVGIRIHGMGTRAHPQKSFRIYAGYQTHDQSISYPIFPDREYSQFSTLLLRAGGGDWSRSFIRDAVTHRLAEQSTDLDTQAVRPAVLYLNGEYWGVYFIRERLDQHYLQYKYGLDTSKISILEVPLDFDEDRGRAVLNFGSDEDAADQYNELRETGLHCNTCAYIGDFRPYMDIDNLIEYYFVQFYINNIDWPYNNTKIWRYRQPKPTDPAVSLPIDGRFRWLLYDLDSGLGSTAEVASDSANSAAYTPYNKFLDPRLPFRNLFFDRTFQQRYLIRITELLNTDFSPQGAARVIDRTAAELLPEMERHLERWRDQPTTYDQVVPQDIAAWEQEVSLLRTFTEERQAAFFSSTVEEFGLEDTIELSFATQPEQAGSISIGRITRTPDELPWTGIFFPDIYMNLSAKPAPGYRFDHWEGDVPTGQQYEQQVVLNLSERETIIAVFRKRKWFEVW